MKRTPASRRAQRGWIGLVVLLIAILIVGMLAKDALIQYGLLGGSPNATTRERTAISPGAMPATDATSAPAAPAAPLERARSLEGDVQRQADDRAQQIDRVAR